MAGLYDGLEEIAFKRVDGGYLFSDAPWLLGPRRHYLVDDVRKAAMAARLRTTIREIQPFVIAAAILIPLLVIVLLRLAVGVSTLNITAFDATGAHTTIIQQTGMIETHGTASVGAGASIGFDVRGLYGDHPTVAFTPLEPNGASETPRIRPLEPAGTGFLWKDVKTGKPRGALVVGPGRQEVANVMLYAILLALGTSTALIASVHIYGRHKMRPLLAGLPRTDQRITCRDGAQSFAAHAPLKFLGMMALGGVLAVATPTVEG